MNRPAEPQAGCLRLTAPHQYLHPDEKAFDELPQSCDTVSMKNITVSIEEKLYRRARMRAAERDTSLSAVVRDFLIGFSGGETDFERRKRLQRETLARIGKFQAGNRLTREEVHDRHGLR